MLYDEAQGLKFGLIKYRKNLKISVFVGSKVYLVIFGFGTYALPRNLVFFDLEFIIFKVFGKI